jgi:hypothetical protein
MTQLLSNGLSIESLTSSRPVMLVPILINVGIVEVVNGGRRARNEHTNKPKEVKLPPPLWMAQ